ncbi:MAG: hypothetical protein INR64_06270 [Caulobacteraceae bacterium]|nr:hypothetical protein [Caulobacter sp.]
MPMPLTADDKRAITRKLGYRLEPRDGADKADLIGPDGRHRGVFRESRATDLWVWNDAVFSFTLFRDREGVVHCAKPSGEGRMELARLWPDGGGRQELSEAALAEGYVRLSGGPVS